jgi:hypothetical protein
MTPALAKAKLAYGLREFFGATIVLLNEFEITNAGLSTALRKGFEPLKLSSAAFSQSSLELIQEYRRLEERTGYLKNNVRSARAVLPGTEEFPHGH